VADWQGGMGKLPGIQTGRDSKLRETYLTKKKEAINLDIIKKQLIETQQSFGALLKATPQQVRNGCTVDRYKSSRTGARTCSSICFAQVRKWQQQLAGLLNNPLQSVSPGTMTTWESLAATFHNCLESLHLNDIAISPNTGGGLSMDATAKTYRYSGR
jgi:type IV pilus assembly protein PilO